MWHKVAKVSELNEGSGKAVSVNGKEVALFRYEGKFFALDNTCPHRGGPLGEGYLEGETVVCPWHAWSFEIKTGKCQTAPDVTQPTYPVKVEGEDILVDA